MTAPTIGRVVYYRPSTLELQDPAITSLNPSEPFRADVCFVNPDGSVNLTVCDHNGRDFTATGIPFFEAQATIDTPHAHWMPYQVATAAVAAAAVVPQPPAGQDPAPPVA